MKFSDIPNINSYDSASAEYRAWVSQCIEAAIELAEAARMLNHCGHNNPLCGDDGCFCELGRLKNKLEQFDQTLRERSL